MIMMDASWLWWMYGLWLMTTTEIVMIIMVVHHQPWSHLLIACRSSYIISSTTTHGTRKNLYNFWLYIAKSQNSLVSLWDFWGPHKFPFTWKNRQAIFQWQKSVIEKIRNQFVFPITDICHRKNTQPTNQWQIFLIEKLRSQLLNDTTPTIEKYAADLFSDDIFMTYFRHWKIRSQLFNDKNLPLKKYAANFSMTEICHWKNAADSFFQWQISVIEKIRNQFFNDRNLSLKKRSRYVFPMTEICHWRYAIDVSITQICHSMWMTYFCHSSASVQANFFRFC